MEKKNQTILEWYRKHQKKIDAPCGGNGVCGKCKVRFKAEAPIPTAREKELLTITELENNIRLACFCEMPDGETEAVEPIGDFWGNEVMEEDIREKKTNQCGNESEKNLQKEHAYGVAIDIGTTTLVMSLVCLLDEQTIGTIKEWNPQRMYGADVMTRIHAANEGSLKSLQEILKGELAIIFERLLKQCNVPTQQVKKVAIVGNTTMLHFLCGYSCEGLGRAPFSPVNLSLQTLRAKACGAKMASDAVIYIFPGISAFVGADIVAGIYACDMDLKEKVGMLIDIGTNGEMVIGNREGFWVASTSAGPVFEGGRISCGMPAISGAITHLTYEDDKWQYKCLGDRSPQGICGSGLIDLLAELYQNHMIDDNGTFSEKYFEAGCKIVTKPEITILQSDIRELQMGKAAIRTGIEILKDRITPEYMYVAGAFGKGIEILSAVTVGMFTTEDVQSLKIVGNTALEGAKKFLFDKDGKERLNRIVEGAKEIVLANEPGFEELYICNMQFVN